MRVQGGSGMGKSALVQRFLDSVVAEGKAATLRGRAYEREAVPYKAFDAVIDSLSRYLLQTTVTMPADVWALARLFPVLRRVPAVSEVAAPAITDLQQVRRRAFSALNPIALMCWPCTVRFRSSHSRTSTTAMTMMRCGTLHIRPMLMSVKESACLSCSGMPPE